jgi:hypothetical protein
MATIQYFITMVIRVPNEDGVIEMVDVVYEVDEAVYNIVKRNVRGYAVKPQSGIQP